MYKCTYVSVYKFLYCFCILHIVRYGFFVHYFTTNELPKEIEKKSTYQTLYNYTMRILDF